MALAFVAAHCAGGQLQLKPAITVEQYQKLSWDEKITFFESLNKSPDGEKKKSIVKTKLPPQEVYNSAFRNPVSAVVIAAIDSIDEKSTPEFKPQFYQLLKHKNTVVRYKACRQIGAKPMDGDLPFLKISLSDADWMVRECGFELIRRYPEEKKNQTYYFTVVSHLDEINPQTLKEIYTTLKWYEDERSFSFMFKRLFFARTPSELIIIMRELAEFKNDTVRQRIWYLSQKHPDFFVREEAAQLLSSM